MIKVLSIIMAITMCAMYLVGTVSISVIIPAKAQDSSTSHSTI